jgi:hypothetical protein
MCFMSDLSRYQQTPVRRTPDGGIDIEAYARAARHERHLAMQEAFRAVVNWLRGLLHREQSAQRMERLG